MKNARINNEIDLSYPESFADMSAEELTRYFGSPDNRWGVYDAEDHIVLSVGWTKAKFLQKLTDAESVLIGIEGRLRRRLLNYQRISSYKYEISKNKANGIRFEYRSNDSVMVQVADLVVFKYKGKFYAVYYITRKTNAASTRPAFQEVLNSVKLG